MPETLHLIVVPHTHWDREWYQTFQQFRMRLVRCVDHVLRVLESDPDFTYFTLDAQLAVLQDYLEVKPEHGPQLRALALAGRLPVGPWYIQPDEFLVGGEAIIRNLLLGRRLAAPYGGALAVGYAPDCFGHIAQMPQIWQGFGIDNAAFMRGVGPEITRSEFWWVAPDGTRVRATYLNGEWGYSNAQALPLTTDELITRLERVVTPMLAHAATPYVLLMNGSDHQEPQDGLPAALQAANARLAERGWQLELGTLAHYMAAVGEADPELGEWVGELRSAHSAPLLPAVLSSRIWIKQRNTAIEEDLTRWVDPFTAWAAQLGTEHPTGLVDLAWRFVLQNQPHDSICGCGIDQVHREMVPRFDQADQIAAQVIDDALHACADQIDTAALFGDQINATAAVVFNPLGWARTAVAEIAVQVAAPAEQLEVIAPDGTVVPHVAQAGTATELIHIALEKAVVESTLTMLDSEGRVMGYRVLGATFGQPDGTGTVPAWIAVAQHGPADVDLAQEVVTQIRTLAARADVANFDIQIVESPRATLSLLARDLPPHGGRAYLVRPRQGGAVAPAPFLQATAERLENADIVVDIAPDGQLTVTDKRTGAVFPHLLQLEDGGDVGDLYTYAPPRQDQVVRTFAQPPAISLTDAHPLRATVTIAGEVLLPVGCTADRQGRSEATIACAISHAITLEAESPVVQVRTTVANHAHDHRLRITFPTAIQTPTIDAEGTFMVNQRPVSVAVPPEVGRTWPEDPVATFPQKRFTAVGTIGRGLAVLNRGLPECEALADADGVTLALTLLRGVGWLSRDDFATRRGQAGPQLATPAAQMLGTWTLDYAIAPLAGDWQAEDGAALQLAHAFNAPVRAVVTGKHGGALTADWSFVRLAPPSLVLSTVKRAEDGRGVIVRWYNPLDVAVTAELATILPFDHATIARLDESDLISLEAVAGAEGHRWRLATPAGRVQSIRLVPISQ